MWTGLAVCVLLLIVDVASVWWRVYWASQQRDRCVRFAWGESVVTWTRGGARIIGVSSGWHAHRLITPGIEWWPTIQTYSPLRAPPRRFISVAIPLWIPLVVVAIPTGFLWRRERKRPRPGHCPHCRYDLTGNVSGVCPECGDQV
jgi:hypothetical protein